MTDDDIDALRRQRDEYRNKYYDLLERRMDYMQSQIDTLKARLDTERVRDCPGL